MLSGEMSRCPVTDYLRRSIRQLCISTLSNYNCTEFDGIICVRVEPALTGSWNYPHRNQQQQHIVIKLRDPSDDAPTGTDIVTSLPLHNSTLCHSASIESRQFEVDQYNNKPQRKAKNDGRQSTNNIVKRVHEVDVIDDVMAKQNRQERINGDVNSTRSVNDVIHSSLKVGEYWKTGNESSVWTPMSLCLLPRRGYIPLNGGPSAKESADCVQESSMNSTVHNIKRCGICSEAFRTGFAVLEHQRHAHSFEDSFSCATCVTFYPSRASFLSHRRLRHRDVTLQCWCDVCDVSFTYVEYKQHERECNRAVERKTNSLQTAKMSPDLEDENTQLASSPPSSTCAANPLSMSDSGLKRLSGSVNNTRESDEGSSEDEDRASSSSSSSSSRGTGEKVSAMTSSAVYRCQLCPSSSFDQFRAYENHCADTHSRLVCPYCSLSFANKRNVERHIRRHTGETPYACDECSFEFYRDDDLRRHKLKHLRHSVIKQRSAHARHQSIT